MKTHQYFCFNPKKVKAFVLGCDPTNFSDNGRPVELDYVFGIGQDHRYFSDILSNLIHVGLHLENIYIQNLVTEYQIEETGKNKNWDTVAALNLIDRKKVYLTFNNPNNDQQP